MPSFIHRAVALSALVALTASALPTAAAAEDTLATIKSRGKMIVGIKADYPPFGFLDGDRNVGLEIDLLHGIAKDLLGKADAIEFVPVVSANRFQFLNTSKVDFLFATVTITDQRKQVVDFSAPYMRSGWQILVKRSNTSIREATDLKGKTVVVVPGSTGEAGISKLVPDATLLKLPQTSEALDAVDQGRADAFIQDTALLVGLTAQKPQYKTVGASHDDMPIGAACRKGDSGPCDFISKEIEKFTRNGTLAKEYRKWLYGAAKRFMP
ncbi:MAG: transporter substrate-binding domain-containing protein [Vulcanimicrobiaceae bacterium]